ncbi:MAG TPA: chemotaxis protein CheD [Anaerolineaceae bacterium]|nr:chemotaxis protein CheD [Anaerolineaceae bacterium]
MTNTISVGLGEQVISRDPEDILVAYGLGSCLGIGMYDPRNRIAGLVHAVLPEQLNGDGALSPKYVNTGIASLVNELVKSGADRYRLIIRIAGGANMLVTESLSKTFDIGTRNIASALQTMVQMNMRLTSQDVGGNVGRTVRLYVANGRMTVRTIGGQERDL